MYIRDINFQVEFSAYAEKHFCKEFLKKYKSKKWLMTKQMLYDILKKAFAFQQTGLVDILRYSAEGEKGLFKLDFRIAGTMESPKSSGNRAVFSLCHASQKIEVLLVYGKEHCKKNQSETQWILEHVKKNFPEHKKLC